MPLLQNGPTSTRWECLNSPGAGVQHPSMAFPALSALIFIVFIFAAFSHLFQNKSGENRWRKDKKKSRWRERTRTFCPAEKVVPSPGWCWQRVPGIPSVRASHCLGNTNWINMGWFPQKSNSWAGCMTNISQQRSPAAGGAALDGNLWSHIQNVPKHMVRREQNVSFKGHCWRWSWFQKV